MSCGHGGGCLVCKRHKYTLIFYQQFETDVAKSKNEGLTEIKDKKVIDEIKEELNLLHGEEEDNAPFICGTVVNGGFTRKLRMLRADLYSLLSVCESSFIVSDKKQIKAIKRGVISHITRN